MANKFKDTLQKNRARRQNMVIRVFECSLRLSKIKKKQLDQMFLEAKWLYNWLLDQKDIFKANFTNNTKIYSLNKNKEKLQFLGVCIFFYKKN